MHGSASYDTLQNRHFQSIHLARAVVQPLTLLRGPRAWTSARWLPSCARCWPALLTCTTAALFTAT